MRESLVISASVIAILSAIIYSVNSPIPTAHFTEFYLYPNSTNFTYGITNYEGKYITYVVKGYLVEGETDERLFLFDETVKIADKETFTKPSSIDGPMYKQITNESTEAPTKSGIVVLELYRKDLPQIQPYRKLHFNISKSEVGNYVE